jgi:hypothetical protein
LPAKPAFIVYRRLRRLRLNTQAFVLFVLFVDRREAPLLSVLNGS